MCDKVIKADPNNAKVGSMKTRLYNRWLQDPEPAIDGSQAYFRKGQVYANNQELDKAETAYKKAVELDPKDPGIRAELSKIRQKQKELAEKSRKELAGMFQKGLKTS